MGYGVINPCSHCLTIKYMTLKFSEIKYEDIFIIAYNAIKYKLQNTLLYLKYVF